MAALYTLSLQRLLHVHPVTLRELLFLLGVSSVIIVVMELHKAWRRHRPLPP